MLGTRTADPEIRPAQTANAFLDIAFDDPDAMPDTLEPQGDRVTAGQPLGLVGNTGNSLAPHLHFHVMDGPSPLASNGVPYVIDAFRTTGRVNSTAAFDTAETTGRVVPRTDTPEPVDSEDELPLDLTVVTFGS